MSSSPKVALVTGSTRGIGRAVASLFAEAGISVVVNGRHDSEQARAVAAALPAASGVSHLFLAFDVSDPKAVVQAYRAIARTYGGLDILVNNAGVLGDGLIGMLSDELIEHTLATNVRGAINNVQAAARLMMRRSAGSIVNIASIVGIRGNPGQAVYSASKAAVIGLTLTAARELGPKGIRVNAVAPGVIATDMIRHLAAEKLDDLGGRIPLGRFGSVRDVAQAVAFLASDQASYISGQVLGVDGAMTL